VKGETRHMKIQNPGNAVGVCKTPLNCRVMVNSSVERAAAVSVLGMVKIIICAYVDANSRNCNTKVYIKPWV
jgi:hypothetical protein